jgi:hypothetical protein
MLRFFIFSFRLPFRLFSFPLHLLPSYIIPFLLLFPSSILIFFLFSFSYSFILLFFLAFFYIIVSTLDGNNSNSVGDSDRWPRVVEPALQMASKTRRLLNIYDREPQRKCHIVELSIDRKIILKIW